MFGKHQTLRTILKRIMGRPIEENRPRVRHGAKAAFQKYICVFLHFFESVCGVSRGKETRRPFWEVRHLTSTTSSPAFSAAQNALQNYEKKSSASRNGPSFRALLSLSSWQRRWPHCTTWPLKPQRRRIETRDYVKWFKVRYSLVSHSLNAADSLQSWFWLRKCAKISFLDLQPRNLEIQEPIRGENQSETTI